MDNNSREASLLRAGELKKTLSEYEEAAPAIPAGFQQWTRILKNQERIKNILEASDEEWQDWRWQLSKRVTTVEELKKYLPLSPQEVEEIEQTGLSYRWAVSPYYLSLIDRDDPGDPVRRQSIPLLREHVDDTGTSDPMDEEHTSPAPAVTRRYPDRLIINVTNQCAMYCRHCQRRRNIGEKDLATSRNDLAAAIDYVRNNKEIRDVLLTGGDAFMLSNNSIAWLLEQLDGIPHVEIKRFGTRTPVTLPYRIDDELCEILSRHLPLYVNTQFNNPLEVTPAAREACFKLARAGVSLGNQTVLLKGVNDDPFVMLKLNQELLRIMVRPYYIFHPKRVRGTAHFWVKIDRGLEIMEHLRGHTSGLAVPTYIINAPGGYGKVPLLPEYLLWLSGDAAVIRTWENRIIKCDNSEAEEW
ncbi:MAG: glutamate 2,3-aminomutase [Firmicutes bacterium]|nr:glutamate 2,3-aminomutase [Bacillota bacterium]